MAVISLWAAVKVVISAASDSEAREVNLLLVSFTTSSLVHDASSTGRVSRQLSSTSRTRSKTRDAMEAGSVCRHRRPPIPPQV